MPDHTSPDVQSLSEVWIAGGTPAQLAELMGHTDTHKALVAIGKLRTQHGKTLFPYRKSSVAEGGYSASKLKKISFMWKKNCTAQELADFLKFKNPASVWGTIAHLRTKHGDELFPHRGGS